MFDVEWVSKKQIDEVKDELHAKTFEYAMNPGAMGGDGIHINSDFLDGLNNHPLIFQIECQ